MALYWHPFLADLLRHRYADRLVIHETVTLGDLPLEADLLLIRREPQHGRWSCSYRGPRGVPVS
jgi:hypothetical protein